MFYSRNKRLFSEYSLSDYLRKVLISLDEEIKGLSYEQISDVDEGDLIGQLITKYQVNIPTLDKKNIDIDAKEATVSVKPEFGFDDGPINVPGLFIIVKIPFSGSVDLLKCRASTYSVSGTPEAEIESGNIVLQYETVEKDSEKIKNLWAGDIKSIQQNLSWIEKDVVGHNSSLENNIKTSLTQRKKEAEENKSLIDKLKE